MDEAEGRGIVAMSKVGRTAFVWAPRSNHISHQHCAQVLFDSAGVTIPGLTVALEIRSPIVTAECLYLFTIFKLERGGGKRRAYQLEVCPAAKMSHRDATQTIYGPHEHFSETAYAVAERSVACKDWQACYTWFMKRCNLVLPSTLPPC